MPPNILDKIPVLVKEAVTRIDSQAKVILFGSRSRGDFRSDSDWDFLIVLSDKKSLELLDMIREQLYDIELSTGQIITSIIEDQSTWSKYEESEIYKNIQQDGIEIIPVNSVQ